MTSCRSSGRAALAALSLLLNQGLVAASLDVNPVRIDLAGPTRPAELRLTNTGDEPLSIQVDALQWTQDFNGADELVDSDAVLAVPPLFTVGPGERQIVRIGYLEEAPRDVERSFRLLVTELAPSASEAAPSSLSMRLRLSIPVFVAPTPGDAAPDVVVSDIQPGPDGMRVLLHNVGNAHVKIKSIDLGRSGEWLAVPSDTVNLIRYLLPNVQAQFTVPGALGAPSAIRITAADGRVWEHAVPRPQ
jgi:fimbrial chaperone protein